MKTPKTTGYQWLCHSLVSFNGSGYADMTSGESFFASYVAYKRWRRLPHQARLALRLREDVISLCDHIVTTSAGAGRTPKPKAQQAFATYRMNLT